MPNYGNGKVYKIYSPSQPELGVYYGSTTQSLALRIGQHRSSAKAGLGVKSAVIIAAGDAVIVLVELCPVTTKEELTAREAFWIRENECVNKRVPGRTRAESSAAYRAAHKVEIAAQMAAYHATHKVEIATRQAAYRASRKVERAAYDAAYRETNRTHINECARARYAAKKAAAAATAAV